MPGGTCFRSGLDSRLRGNDRPGTGKKSAPSGEGASASSVREALSVLCSLPICDTLLNRSKWYMLPVRTGFPLAPRAPLGLNKSPRGKAPLALNRKARGRAPLALNRKARGRAPLALNRKARGRAPLALNRKARGRAPL